MYLGFGLIRYRNTHRHLIEGRSFYTQRSLEQEVQHAMQGHAVKYQGWSGGKGETLGKSLYYGFQLKEMGKAG